MAASLRGAGKLQIRNPKHEIPGPDPATTDSVLGSEILGLTE